MSAWGLRPGCGPARRLERNAVFTIEEAIAFIASVGGGTWTRESVQRRVCFCDAIERDEIKPALGQTPTPPRTQSEVEWVTRSSVIHMARQFRNA